MYIGNKKCFGYLGLVIDIIANTEPIPTQRPDKINILSMAKIIIDVDGCEIASIIGLIKVENIPQ